MDEHGLFHISSIFCVAHNYAIYEPIQLANSLIQTKC